MASVLLPFTAEIQQSAISAGLQTFVISSTTLDVYSDELSVLQSWLSVNNITSSPISRQMAARFCSCVHTNDTLTPHSTNVPYFTMSQVRSIYQIPNPTNTKYVVGVMSFGGGLYGTVDSQGVLTNGDVQSYWTSIGISVENQPKVIVVPINGAINLPNINDGGSTIENTLDVEVIGGACPSANLTIILYIAPNSFNQFAPILNYMYSNTITVNGENYKPNLISCSWGAPEFYFTNSQLSAINAVLTSMTAVGINICAATGDYGSNNGVGGTGNYVDFPSSNPNITAVGGTNMVCPNNIYDSQTVETAWASGGGGISAIYSKPSYQSKLPGTNRSTPDVASISDPNTGVVFTINGQLHVIGGTSVAAPTIAGFLAAINCRTFINPLFYQAPYASCFHDVTRGSNGGYNAGIVYDNCTGLGSINGAALADYIANPTIQVSSITLNMTSITMSPTQTSQLIETVLPANATNKAVVWSSSSPSMVTVTNGLMTALTTGSSTITATSTDGSNISASVAVTVRDVNVPITEITLNYTTATLQPNNTITLIPTIVPSNATEQTIVWSSNSSNVTVSTSGLVTARSAGTAIITATTVSGNLTASCTITVVIPVVSLSLSPTILNMDVRTTRTIIATIFPSNATNKQITWSSSNTTIAAVSSSGVVASGNTYGSAVITARSVDSGSTATVSISVGVGVQSVSLNALTISLAKGNTFQAITTIQPNTAANTNITWMTALSSVATVSSSGLITAVGNGTGIIMAITQDKNKMAFMVVRVTTPVASISLNQTTLITSRNATSTLTATILPSNASNKLIAWTSSNPTVATVSSTGVVHGVSMGNTTITAQAVDGGLQAVCNVIVH